jgi:Ulp1 family protease
LTVVQTESALLVIIPGATGPYPYEIKKHWMNHKKLTEAEHQEVFSSLDLSKEQNRTALPMDPRNPLPRKALKDNTDLTYSQLRCLMPEQLLNDQVINTSLALLQRLTRKALVMSTYTYTRYYADCLSSKTWGGKRKLRKAIDKHMDLYQVRTASVPNLFM